MMYRKLRMVRASSLRLLLVFAAFLGICAGSGYTAMAQDSSLGELSLQPAPSGDALYVSFARPGKIGNISFDGSDILVYYQKRWSIFFDGSDVGTRGQNLNAFEILADDSILMTFTPRTLALPGLGHVTHNDVLRFVPQNTGPLTRGRFDRFLKGLDVGLSTAAEAIDALAITPDGRLALSTAGRAVLPGATGDFAARGQDIVALTVTGSNPASGLSRSGYWQSYAEGEALELSGGGENVNGLWIKPPDAALYLTMRNRFTVSGLSGNGTDILLARPEQAGDFVRWNYLLYLNGDSLTLKANLDGLAMATYPLGPRGFHYPRRR